MRPAEQDHAQRVADEQEIGAGAICEPGGDDVVRRDHGEGDANPRGGLPAGNLRDGEGGGHSGMGVHDQSFLPATKGRGNLQG